MGRLADVWLVLLTPRRPGRAERPAVAVARAGGILSLQPVGLTASNRPVTQSGVCDHYHHHNMHTNTNINTTGDSLL